MEWKIIDMLFPKTYSSVFQVEDLNLGVNTGPDSRELRCIGDVYLKQPGDNKIPSKLSFFL